MEAKQTPLIDLLERVPRDAVLVVEHDQFDSSSHPIGRLCHEAAAALRACASTHADGCWSWGHEHYECAVGKIKELLEERDALREALSVLVNWTPSADTYRRMGFDPETPMRAHEAAKAALARKR